MSQDYSQNAAESQDLRDLKTWRAFALSQSGNMGKVLDAFLQLAIEYLEENPTHDLSQFRAPWSAVKWRFRKGNDPYGYDALNQYVQTKTQNNWFESRIRSYEAFCADRDARPLHFIRHEGSPALYGFSASLTHPEGRHDFILEDAILKWRREDVPEYQLSRLGAIFYPNGIYRCSGWRSAFLFAANLLPVIIFVFFGLMGIVSGYAFQRGVPGAIIPALVSFLFSYVIAKYIMQPILRDGDLRTSRAPLWYTKSGGEAWVQRYNVNLGIEKSDPNYNPNSVPHRQLVRWKADCAICGAPVELTNNSPVQSGLVGCCVESPDEHSYSFDRQTLEGIPLRSKPAKTRRLNS